MLRAMAMALLHPQQRDDTLAANALRALQHVAASQQQLMLPLCGEEPLQVLAASMHRLLAMWPPPR